jgi:hypothetical protein
MAALLAAGAGAQQGTPGGGGRGGGGQPTVAATPEQMRKGDYLLSQHKLNVDAWPRAVLSFSLVNEKQELFRQLKTGDLKVFVDDAEVRLDPDALRVTESDPVNLLLLIDGSKSMLGGSGRLNKLGPSQEAIRAFLAILKEQDAAAVYAFDSSTYPVNDLTTAKFDLGEKVKVYAPRMGEESNTTDLYKAVEDAVGRARELNVRNLIVISDGMQDTAESEDIRKSDADEFEEYKRGEERKINELASRNGVTIYTIPIGDRDSLPAEPRNLSYVDADTLCKMTSQQAGGGCVYVGLRELSEEQADSPGSTLQELLARRLKEVFTQIDRSVRYGYALTMPLDGIPRDSRQHKLRVQVPGGGAVFDVDYTFNWGGGKVPEVGGGTISVRPLIAVPKIDITEPSLGAVYLGLLGVIGVIGLVPIGIERYRRSNEAREGLKLLRNSVVKLKAGSALVGQDCPNHPLTPKPLKAGDVAVICPKCGQPHHLACWHFNKFRCMKWLCTGELPLPEAVFEKHGVTVT